MQVKRLIPRIKDLRGLTPTPKKMSHVKYDQIRDKLIQANKYRRKPYLGK